MTTPAILQPGDLLLTRSASLFGRLIRLGGALRDEPSTDNHVAIVHHTDLHGTTWCLEGRPGGVGWHDASDYLRSPWTLNNAGQLKPAAARGVITAGAHAMIGSEYDWDAIAGDALRAFGIPLAEAWNVTGGRAPGEVVCSSLAAYLYGKAGLQHPPGGRLVTPADWELLITANSYSQSLR